MSHFTMLVVIPEGNSKEEYIQKIMMPYDENRDVAPYDRPCHCINYTATVEGREAAEKELGTNIQELRESFKEKCDSLGLVIKFDNKKDPTLAELEKISEIEEKRDALWKEHIKTFIDLCEKKTKEHPMFNKPKDDCGECKGTGKYTSTYNPDSKWDWYEEGGRWNGFFKGKNEVTGKTYKKFFKGLPNEFSTFGFIDKEGRWVEKGQMGYWAVVFDEKDKEAWQKEFANFVENGINDKDTVVVLDCHI